ncbi:'Cold-shock' DNA-binding domain protein, partial [Vibrio cholerae HC-69A1]
YCAVISSD